MRHAIVASGVTSEAEMGLDTLEQRLAEQPPPRSPSTAALSRPPSHALSEANAVYTVPTVVGGWGRRP
jgi:hypothetical protein